MADVAAGEEDLDGFFKEKDRKKQERQALKKAKAKAERETVPPLSAWMTADEQELQGDELSHDQQSQQAEDLTSEEMAARMQAQATIYRPEDDDWIDPEREFAPVPGASKKKHRQDQTFAQDDKLLLLVAPTASKLQDLSEMSADKLARSKVAPVPTSTGSKGWSKIEAKVEPAPIPPAGATAGQVAAKEVESEPVKKSEPEPERAATEPAGEPAPVGVFIPPHMRSKAGQGAFSAAPPASGASSAAPPASGANRSRERSESPASRPADAADPNAYIPPARRAQMEEATRRNAAPSPFNGPSRPAGSGLAAATTTRQVQAAKQKVLPDLQSADEFPSLG